MARHVTRCRDLEVTFVRDATPTRDSNGAGSDTIRPSHAQPLSIKDLPGSDLEGRDISHYRVIRRIGAGGMGIVYEAEDLNLGRRVALKFLPAALQKNAQALERFKREARSASAPNAVYTARAAS